MKERRDVTLQKTLILRMFTLEQIRTLPLKWQHLLRVKQLSLITALIIDLEKRMVSFDSVS